MDDNGCDSGSYANAIVLFPGSEYMKEAGLELLSGEQQRTLQEQLDNAQTSLVNTEEEIKDKKKLVYAKTMK